jgi:hypothetical protein
MSIMDTIYRELREQDIGTDVALYMCQGLHDMTLRHQYVFLRRVQGYSQTEIGNELHRHQKGISEMIRGPLHAVASILEYSCPI